MLHDNTQIGNSVVIHSGSVLGTDGFGYMFIENRHYKIPQIGRVIVEDDVEIGANVTIDKARTGSTRIGAGTKIDNLVHIGHNVTVGKNCVIVAQVGVSGSVEIGNGVILAGQVGIKDHVTIGDGIDRRRQDRRHRRPARSGRSSPACTAARTATRCARRRFTANCPT